MSMSASIAPVFSEKKKFKKFERALQRTALCSLQKLRKRGISLEIFLVSDATMKSINRKYRGKPKPTNVLSFEVPFSVPRPDLGRTRFIGELFLAPDWAEKKGDELGFLVVHGILHLLGYTHEGAKESIMMNNLERKIWNQLCQKS